MEICSSFLDESFNIRSITCNYNIYRVNFHYLPSFLHCHLLSLKCRHMKITLLKSFASPHRHQRGLKTTFLPVMYKLQTNSNIRTGFIFSVHFLLRPSENMLIRANTDGTYSANWTPGAVGLYTIHVTIDGIEIGNCFSGFINLHNRGLCLEGV